MRSTSSGDQGKPHAPNLLRGQLAALQSVDVVRIVCIENFLIRSCCGTCTSSLRTRAASKTRCRRSAYFRIGKRCSAGSGKTKQLL